MKKKQQLKDIYDVVIKMAQTLERIETELSKKDVEPLEENQSSYEESVGLDQVVQDENDFPSEWKRAEWPSEIPINTGEIQCSQCGMIFKGPTGYVCHNPNCPVFTVISS
jgi:hypothetical protein